MPDHIDAADLTALQAKADAGVRGARLLLGRRKDRDMRREIILREINQGALAGFDSRVTEQAADLVIDALDAYDASRESGYWTDHPWECVPHSLLVSAVRSRESWQRRCNALLDGQPDPGPGA